MSDSNEMIRNFVMRAIEGRALTAPNLVPSEYWTDFARNFRYVYELSDDELARIRFHTYHLTSDSYLTYYFAEDAFKNIMRRGYRCLAVKKGLGPIEEGEDGIGIPTENGRISHDLLRYIGVIGDLTDSGLLDRETQKKVIEIGGGYGGLARSHLLHNPNITYFICDLEETLFFSAVYLTKHFGSNRVHLVDSEVSINDIHPGHVYIVPQSKIDYLSGTNFDYAVSQQSIQEMTRTQVERYLDWISMHASAMYSCNIVDHANLAKEKKLAINLPEILESYFSKPIWQGVDPLSEERFGDNHLPRAVYKCQ